MAHSLFQPAPQPAYQSAEATQRAPLLAITLPSAPSSQEDVWEELPPSHLRTCGWSTGVKLQGCPLLAPGLCVQQHKSSLFAPRWQLCRKNGNSERSPLSHPQHQVSGILWLPCPKIHPLLWLEYISPGKGEYLLLCGSARAQQYCNLLHLCPSALESQLCGYEGTFPATVIFF